MNAALAQRVLDELYRLNVREIVVCPAGRNAPWVELLASSENRFEVTWHFEERSAAFLALGRARQSGRPVAVCTTSGTAVGELLPAAMEAAYSGVPLVLLTADRPIRFRGSGAPQAAVQPGLFGVYARAEHDFSFVEQADLGERLPEGPIHINVCFEDPNGGAASDGIDEGGLDAEEFFERYTKPLVIVGGLREAERADVTAFLLELGAPTYFEAPSGLREAPSLAGIRVTQGDGFLERATQNAYAFDSLIRVGSVPTHRLWRDLEDKRADLPVLSLSRLPFTGLGRPSSLVVNCLPKPPKVDRTGWAELKQADDAARLRLDTVLADEPKSEQAMIRALSEHVGEGAMVYLGNSLPIREWDLTATFKYRTLQIEASRGLNGIDGQVSTFLGLCRPGRQNWAIIGDLTALYDLAGPWAMPKGVSATLVVVNNGGGRIFERMFKPQEFQNDHSVSFEAWASLWKLPYLRTETVSEIPPAPQGLRIVELVPDNAATSRVWEVLK